MQGGRFSSNQRSLQPLAGRRVLQRVAMEVNWDVVWAQLFGYGAVIFVCLLIGLVLEIYCCPTGTTKSNQLRQHLHGYLPLADAPSDEAEEEHPEERREEPPFLAWGNYFVGVLPARLRDLLGL